MKRFLSVSALAIILSILVSCENSTTPIDASNLPKSIESASSSVQTLNNGTEQEVMLIAEATFSAGCENWKKGDNISFEVTSDDNFEAEIGIISVLSNGDYDKVYSETINVNPESKSVVIEVPDDGDYGIYYKNNDSKEVIFKVKLNQVLKNPLV